MLWSYCKLWTSLKGTVKILEATQGTAKNMASSKTFITYLENVHYHHIHIKMIELLIASSFLSQHFCKHQLEVLLRLVSNSSSLFGRTPSHHQVALEAVVLWQVVLVSHVNSNSGSPLLFWLELLPAKLTLPGLLALLCAVYFLVVAFQDVSVQKFLLAKLAPRLQRNLLANLKGFQG